MLILQLVPSEILFLKISPNSIAITVKWFELPTFAFEFSKMRFLSAPNKSCSTTVTLMVVGYFFTFRYKGRSSHILSTTKPSLMVTMLKLPSRLGLHVSQFHYLSVVVFPPDWSPNFESESLRLRL